MPILLSKVLLAIKAIDNTYNINISLTIKILYYLKIIQ
jgi:hypothetical protein